ncbi:MAG: hypothetical protein AB6733_12090 [Clostridiaceae bacterium]
MGAYTIYSNQKINWNAKGIERTLQNIVNLINTFMYEVAYDRVMGRDPTNLDKPLDKMIPAIISETYDLIQEYAPKTTIEQIEVINSIEGDLVIKAVINIE